MVDLEPVEDPKDIQLIRELIQEHVDATGSPRGEWILDNWDTMLPRFIKVFPHEYKRVLGVARRAKQYRMPVPEPVQTTGQQVLHG